MEERRKKPRMNAIVNHLFAVFIRLGGFGLLGVALAGLAAASASLLLIRERRPKD